MRPTRHSKGKAGKALPYSFAFIIVVSLMCALALPRGFASGKEESGDKTLAPNAPTQARLRGFEAYHFGRQVWLEWHSEYELDNLGYNVYREQDGQRVLLTPSLIAGSAVQAGPGIALSAGNSYAWREKFPGRGGVEQARYWLESVDLNGKSRWHGPINSKAGDAAKTRPAASKLLTEYAVEPARVAQSEWPAPLPTEARQPRFNSLGRMELDYQVLPPELDQQWAIAAQVGVKIKVNHEGWQRVSRAELLAAGLDQAASLANLQLYMGGVEQAMVVGADGSIEFYGQPLLTKASDTRVYYLIAGTTPGKRVNVSSAGPFDPNVQAASFASTIERRDRTFRFPALLNGEAENFFGPVISSGGLQQTMQVKGLDQTAMQAQLEVGVQGLSQQAHQVRVQINGSDLGFINYNLREGAVAQFTVSPAQLREHKNAVTLTGTAPGSDVSFINFVRLTYPRRYEAASNQLQFSVPAGQPVKVGGFAHANIRVLDITDAANIKELTVSPQASGGVFAFTLSAEGAARTLLAFNSGSYNHPLEVLRNEPSSWHLTTNAVDLLIITHKDFRQSIEPLRALRQSQGMQVALVDVEDVYDEFSFGAHTPQALIDFLARAKSQWQTAPRYLLLVGDATADPRDYFGLSSKDFVPTRMVDGVFSESPSDDSLIDTDNDGLAEMAVGRFSVATAQQATTLVNKVITYEQGIIGSTQERGAVMVSDHFDVYDFVAFTADVRTSLPPNMSVQFINRTDGDAATVRAQIISAINAGPGVVNYLGHGSVGVWTGEGLLRVEDAASFTNSQRLSIFVMMTCLNGAFTEVGTDSLAEAIHRTPNGGAVSILASSGLTVPYGQVAVSKRFYELLFTGQAARVGDASKEAKAATTDVDIRRLSILFGDPSMRFR